MPLTRREFLGFAAASMAAGLLPHAFAAQGTAPRIKAIAFDAFPIFDLRPVFARVEQFFPGQGEALGLAWRTRQFEYQWLRALSGHYADFRQVTDDALQAAAEALKLELTEEKRRKLVEAYLELKVWPDVPAALQAFRRAGIRLALLSNATPQILEANVRNAGLTNTFEFVLSTDRVKTFKPDPRAYQLALDAFGVKKEEILFVAFTGWDAAGAKAFGYPTFWANRLNLPADRLGYSADAVGKNLDDLVDYVESLR